MVMLRLMRMLRFQEFKPEVLRKSLMTGGSWTGSKVEGCPGFMCRREYGLYGDYGTGPRITGVRNRHRHRMMSTEFTGRGGVVLAESWEFQEEEEDAGRSADGSKITRYNKKWLKKKSKKGTDFKVVEYKEIRDETLDQILETFPQVAEMDRETLKVVMANSALYGFSPTKTAKILSRYPEFLDNYDTLLPQSAKAWRRIGIAEKDRVMLFHRFPPLMDLTQEAVAKTYGFLSEYFSPKELILFIRNNPKCMVEDENSLKSKLDLLWKKYSHSTLNIARSEAPSRSFNHIRTRHEFLIRAGFFKPMSFHKFLRLQAEEDRRRIVTERDRYFAPMLIVCTSDEKFLSGCTQDQLTVDELQVFQDFLEKEEHDEELQEWFSQQGIEESHKIMRSSYNVDTEEDSDEEQRETTDLQNVRYLTNNSEALFSSNDGVDFFF